MTRNDTDTDYERTHRAEKGRGRTHLSRRTLLAAVGGAGASALAGCQGLIGRNSDGQAVGDLSLSQFRGSGPLVETRDAPGGTSIADLPDLEGSLNIYLGGGEDGLYLGLLDIFTNIYPDFEYQHRLDSGASLANTIVEEVEAGSSPADAFITTDASSLVATANAGAAESLSPSVREPVDDDFATEEWIGIGGRARAVPYNTQELSASDIPDSVQAFPESPALSGPVGWAPTYGEFQAFVTAMRLLEGDDETRQWLIDMQEAGVIEFPDEFQVTNAVANGDLPAGFANHYYTPRVLNARPDAPLDLAFTSGDAGAMINVSGGLAIRGTDRLELVENLLRHLTSAEAQEYLATRAFDYPTIPGVSPVGGLPSIDELDPPSIDPTELGDLEGTLTLLRETGVL